MTSITGGSMRGRPLHVPPEKLTRPTQSKFRKSIFDTLQSKVDFEGQAVLDLFAGSGALGLEAMSRGASSCIFVEEASAALRVIQKNLESLGLVEAGELVSGSVFSRWGHLLTRGPFSLIMADPPYGKSLALKLIEKEGWETLLSPGGVLVLESSKRDEDLPEKRADLVKITEKLYGDTRFTFYRNESNQGAISRIL